MSRRVAITVEANTQPAVDGFTQVTIIAGRAKKEIDELGKKVDEAGAEMDAMAAQAAVAKKEVDGLGRQASQTGADMERLATDAELAALGVDRLGNKSRGSARDLQLLDSRIDASKTKVKELGLEFARTGEKVDSANLGRERSLLSRLERLRTELTKAAEPGKNNAGPLAIFANLGEDVAKPAAMAGTLASTSFMQSLMGGIKDVPLGPVLIGALVGAAAAALPVLGGMVAGAVVGGVGTLGIVGGVIASTKDPLVQSAFKQFTDSVSTEFFSAGAAFVDPVRESLGILKADVESLNLDEVFAKVAPQVTIIASGLGDMIKNTMPGLNKALDRTGPFANAAAAGFASIGTAFSGFLDDVSGSHGALEGLQLLFALISGTVTVLGNGIKWLADRLHDLDVTFEWIVGKSADIADALGLPSDSLHKFEADLHNFNQFGPLFIQDSADKMGNAYELMVQKAEEAQKALMDVQQAISSAHDAELAFSDSTIAVAQDFADLTDKLKVGKGQWDLNTQAGRDHNEMINKTIGDLGRERDAAIANSDGSIDAIDAINRKYNDQIAQLAAVAAAAGMAQAAVQNMVHDYHFTIYGDVVVRNTATKQAAVSNQKLRLGGDGFATGGDPPPGLSWVGEHGKELVDFAGREHVYNNQQSMAMARQWNGRGTGGGSSTGPLQATLTYISTGDKVIDALLQGLRLKINAGYSL